jgi:hypothetical protein
MYQYLIYYGAWEGPVWNGSSYDYPSGSTVADFPAFQHCTDLGE